MSGLKRLGYTHACELAKGSNSCLPKLPPQANKLKRWIREFHKSLMVSAENTNSRFFFKSRAAIYLERKRHIRTSYVFIIHPFSKFCVHRETIMCLLWMFTFFKDPFTTAYFKNSTESIKNDTWRIIDLLVDVIMVSNIMLCFITGTYKVQIKEVVLDPLKIAKRYLLTYFVFDFFGTIPFNYVTGIFTKPSEQGEIYFTIIACMHFLRFVRIKTTLEYFRRITDIFGCEDTTHEIICLILLSFYFLHWWACLIFIIPKVAHGLRGGELSNSSWIVMARIHLDLKDVNLSQRYTQCMLSAFCHFYRAGYGMYITEDPLEQIMFSYLMITGIFFNSYVIVVVLQMVRSANASESKYEELVNQLREYSQKKKLPPHIRRRLMLYYENRFQKHYFKEETILNTLSNHLRYEIFLHSCKGLVEKVVLFQGLSKSSVGSIVGCLKHEVFLPNDVIIKVNSEADCMYFISYGTVAYITASGKEICHYEDGDHFGEIQLFIKSASEHRHANVVALEITELFKLEKKDLDHCIFQDEEIAEQFEKVAQERFAHVEATANRKDDDDSKHRHDVLYELRRGRILEHTHRKRRRT